MKEGREQNALAVYVLTSIDVMSPQLASRRLDGVEIGLDGIGLGEMGLR